MRLIYFVCALLLTASVQSQQTLNVYPTHWWAGMKNQQLQLLVKSPGIGKTNVALKPYAGVQLKGTHTFKNPDYLAIDLQIGGTAKPGELQFSFAEKGKSAKQVKYILKARDKGNGRTRIKGVGTEDFIYLIMPDRFSNGDPSNDKVPGMLDQSLDRSDIWHRHGGDLKGIENQLDYLQDIGVTALWLNPVLENDMPNRTEHGYAATDHYSIDPRLGGIKAYHSLINALHKRDMKIIQDAVYNHVGIHHFLYKEMPDSSWFHWWPSYTNTTYKDQTLMDPYAAAIDKKKMSDGWFVPGMPDLNQHNPFMANFLIQHAIWCTEEFGLDGWRIDTYAYNDLEFMNRCNKALLDEYPQLHIFGETWVHGVANQSYFAANNIDIPYKSNLPGVTDFQLNLYGIVPALTQAFGWTDGVNKLYSTAAKDFLYKDPKRNVIFLDNHDISRFYSQVGESIPKLKMGLSWLLTYRGIPQLYYGTEVLLKGFANPDGLVRQDFPGGWAGDSSNKFTAAGRTPEENEVFNHMRSLSRFRLGSPALQHGKMMQYVPEDGVYVYFRYDAKQTILCIMNTNDQPKTIAASRFEERFKGFSSARDIITNQDISIRDSITIPSYTLLTAELVR
ncbi:glycoside hydrolase family 13 protein [Pseudobacter ginsenosidimutans]|uniref:Glycosidase n=1 Tax=Pseudobacter ginsenosidimutans TaxID=661488 RepID=A0A4Q7N3W5_9BACT|nr:glycoside hydrolase family 13 protein [Pseudobacter ginsenosidimutans]QEC44211.1 alpha-amylase [Pseudobacter ginsenosidimutans]RZS75669.1 glycosidase [Pseudobacter ginsenosidimutans]